MNVLKPTVGAISESRLLRLLILDKIFAHPCLKLLPANTNTQISQLNIFCVVSTIFA